MPPEEDQDHEGLLSLSVEVDEELVLLSQAEGAPDDEDIEVVEYEVSLNSLHRAIHVVRDSGPQTAMNDAPPADGHP